MRYRGLVWALAIGCGCGAGARGRRTDTTLVTADHGGEGEGAVAPGGLAADSPLARRVDEFARQLAPRHVEFAGIASSGFITHGTEVTTGIEVPAGRCLSVVALASAGIRDLDAHLFDPNGELVAEDVETDAHPTVQLCATGSRRVYHVIEAFEGQGAYVVARFVTDRSGLDEVARVVGGHPGTAAGAGGDRSGAERRLNELREGIGRRGFAPSGDATRADFPSAGAQRFPLAVTPDRCYTLAALADGDITDTDLSVYDPAGEEVARDVRPDRDAFVQLCPAAAGTLAVEVRARPGVGAVLLQSFTADAATVGGANTLWLGERTAWGASAVPLAEAETAAARALAAMGYATAAHRQALTLAPGELREVSVTLEPGRCTAVAATAGRGLGRLALELVDRGGDRLARGAFRAGTSVAVVCPTARETLRAVVTAEVGAGEASLTVVPGAAAPAWVAGTDPEAVSEALADGWTAEGTWTAEGAPEKAHLGTGALRTREIDRAAGRCVRVAVSTGHGMPWVALALRGAGGEQVAAATGEGTAAVTRCGAGAEHLRLEARTDPPGAADTEAVITRWERAAP